MTSSAYRARRPMTMKMMMTKSAVGLRRTKKKSHAKGPEADVGDGAEVANLRLWKKHRRTKSTMNRTMMMI